MSQVSWFFRQRGERREGKGEGEGEEGREKDRERKERMIDSAEIDTYTHRKGYDRSIVRHCR